jgi:hypothetical protein
MFLSSQEKSKEKSKPITLTKQVPMRALRTTWQAVMNSRDLGEGMGGRGVLLSPGDNLANCFQKLFHRWLLERLPRQT